MPAPRNAEFDERLEEAVLFYLKATDAGSAIDRDDLLAAFPDLADALATFLDDQGCIATRLEPLRARTQPKGDDRPRQFGKYELLEPLGQGGMGIVFKARQTDVNRLVALKMIRIGSWASPADIQRFRNEAQTSGAFQHPRIVPIYDIGEYDRQIYFTMPWLEGGSLNNHLGEFQADQRRAATIVASIARALHHSHQRGILHRDIKPSNILLDSNGEAFLADFGLAKRLDAEGGVTQTGDVLGTPSYMAPEQAFGKSSEITTATDVYGLGAVLYTLLTGRAPYLGSSPFETLQLVQKSELSAPSVLNRQVDRDLEAICLKCLEKRPEDRFASAEAFAEDLEAWLAGRATKARRLGHVTRAWRWCRRNAVIATSLAILMLVLMAGAITLSVGYVVVSRARDHAEQQAKFMRRRLYADDMRVAWGLHQRGELGKAVDVLSAYLPAPGQEDLRGFEWHYLHNMIASRPSEVLTYRGHRRVVFHAIFSPFDDVVASAGEDGEIHLWEAATGKTLRIIPSRAAHPEGHLGDINWLSFSPTDPHMLASCAEDSTIRLWNWRTGRLQFTLTNDDASLECAVFSPDGQSIAAGGASGFLDIWDLETRSCRNRIKAHDGIIETIAYSPDGKHVFTASHDAYIKCWDTQTGEQRFASSIGRGPVLGVSCSADGKRVVSVTLDGIGEGADAVTGERYWSYPIGGDRPRGVAHSPAGQQMAVCRNDGRVQIWSTSTNELLTHFQAHSGSVWSVNFSPDGRRLLTASSDSTVRIWNCDRPIGYHFLPFSDTKLAAFELSPDGRFVALYSKVSLRPSSSDVCRMIIGELETGAVYSEWEVEQPYRAAIAWSPDSRAVLYSLRNGTVRRFDLESRTERVVVEPLEEDTIPRDAHPPDNASHVMALLPGEGHDELLVAYRHGSIRQFRLATSTVQMVRQPKEVWFQALLRGSERRTIVVGQRGLYIWHPNRGELSTLDFKVDDADSIITARLNHDGRLAAVGLQGGEIKLVDSVTGEIRQTFLGHPSAVLALAITDDGKTIASGGADGTVRLWHIASGQELITLEDRHGAAIEALRFTPDGRRLVVFGRPVSDGRYVSLHSVGP